MSLSNSVSQVVIQKPAGHNLLSIAQFLSYPLQQRIDLILENKVEFLSPNGDAIPCLEALQILNNTLL
jgi:hypothetical protein